MAQRTATDAKTGFERLGRASDAARIEREYQLKTAPQEHYADTTDIR
jgi:hypothetical protein